MKKTKKEKIIVKQKPKLSLPIPTIPTTLTPLSSLKFPPLPHKHSLQAPRGRGFQVKFVVGRRFQLSFVVGEEGVSRF